MLVAGRVGILLAWMGIRHRMDQIIAGTVINIGAVGITNFLFLRILSRNTQFNTPPTIGPWRVPLLADIPVLGPIFFSATPYVYLMYVMVGVLTYMLFRTRWGLRLRASGEKPAAAGTVGINVIAIRYRSLFLAGLICGIAGSYLSLSVAGSFGMDMVAGKGFIALAAMIFGAWHPVGALGAALVFGFAGTTQTLLAILGVNVPPQLLNSVPYVVTIIVVAGVVGRVRGPAAAGQPYEQGDRVSAGWRGGLGPDPLDPDRHKVSASARTAPFGTPERPLPLIIDSDPGLDDALAIGLAVARPELDLLAVTTVGGNADVTHCTENALRLLHAFGRADIPVGEGAAGPLVGSIVRATEVHGEGGIGTTPLDPSPAAAARTGPSALMARLLAEQSGSGRHRADRAAHEHRAAAATPSRARDRGSPTCRSWAARSGRGTRPSPPSSTSTPIRRPPTSSSGPACRSR